MSNKIVTYTVHCRIHLKGI